MLNKQEILQIDIGETLKQTGMGLLDDFPLRTMTPEQDEQLRPHY